MDRVNDLREASRKCKAWVQSVRTRRFEMPNDHSLGL
jgi:hypothetical protein